MEKDKARLKEEIKVFQEGENMFADEFNAGVQDALEYVQELIDQLDEPEVEQSDKKTRELESYNDELIRDNNQLRRTIDSQESLSQKWIDENKVARIDNLRKMTTSDVVPVEKLQNLLVPKQEKPVIPQWLHRIFRCERDAIQQKFVDPWLVGKVIETRLYMTGSSNSNGEPTLFKGEKQREYIADNYEMVINALFNGYEVEREKLYYIYDKSTNAHIGYNADKTRLSWYTSSFPNDVFTESEIKAIDERYWAFAEEVEE